MSFPQLIDSALDDLQAILLSFLVKLGPFFVALMPALFTGYAILKTFEQDAGFEIALFFALVVSIAVETVGIVATHTAIDLYNGKESGYIQPVKFWLMAAMVPVYVGGVAFVIGYAEDAFTPIVRALGIASPFLTCIVYIAVALARDLDSMKNQHASISDIELAEKRTDAEHKRLLEREKLAMKRDIELAKIEAGARMRIEANREPAQKQVEPARASIQCECGKWFGTVQALNAHKRFCDSLPVNGKG